MTKTTEEKVALVTGSAMGIFVDTFPMTGSGKIQKFKLKDLGLKLLQEQGITPA